MSSRRWVWGALATVVVVCAFAAGAVGASGLARVPGGPQTRLPTESDDERVAQVFNRFGDIHLPSGTLAYRDAVCRTTDLTVVAAVLETTQSPAILGRITRPQTAVSLFVEGVVQGESGPWLALMLPVGLVHGAWHGAFDVPRMRKGQRYLLLLHKAREGDLRIVGNGAGAVRLDPDARLPAPPVLRTTWDFACGSPLAVQQLPFPEYY